MTTFMRNGRDRRSENPPMCHARKERVLMIEPLDRVLGAGRHLLALINDILDLSKIEAGRMELNLETFALPPLIDEVVKTIEPLAAKNGNQVAVHYDTEIGTLHADQM